MGKDNNSKDKSLKNLWYLKSSGILFIVYLIFSYIVNKDIFRTADYDIMVFLQEKISRLFDMPFSLFTVIGSSEVTLFFCLLFFIYFIVKRKHLFLGIGLFFLIMVIEMIGKFTIYHPKPPNIFFRYSLDLHLPSGYIVDTHFSYPSGHMARATFITVVFLFLILQKNESRYKNWISFLFICLFIAGMFISRIYLGEHWITDVIGGVLLGGSVGMLSLYFW